ncbi:hypothetical protein Tco_0505654 [Tanacetum coccineum]
MGIMPTKTELALEQTQQGVSNKVLVGPHRTGDTYKGGGYTMWNYHGEKSDDNDGGGGGGDVSFDGSDEGTDDMSDDDLYEMLDNIGQST